jgi:arginine/lysine/ornithine decarboxylase
VTATAPPVHDPAPFLEALRSNREQGMLSFSCPGHKGGQGAADGVLGLLGQGVFDHDVWLNTADHDRLRRVAESLAARTWGADRSFFLVNGSSSGNQAYLLAAVGPGDEVVVGRDLHKSLLVGLILTGARPVYVAPRVHPELGSASGWPRPTSPPPSTVIPRPGWSPWSARRTTG